MARIPRLHLLDDNDDRQQAHPMGIRSLRKSGGSAVVTLPPKAIEFADMNPGDDLVVHATENSITLTKFDDV